MKNFKPGFVPCGTERNSINMQITSDIEKSVADFKREAATDKNFDIIIREFKIGIQKAAFFLLDGDSHSQVTTQIMRSFLEKHANATEKMSAEDIMNNVIPFVEVTLISDIDNAIITMMTGPVIMFVDGIDVAFAIDAKQFPQRETAEPETDKVIRGSRDGFVEITIFNAALIRRRIHSKFLRMEQMMVGNVSPTAVIVCYMDNKCDKKLLKKIKDKISKIDIDALVMNQETLAENLFPPIWYNPLPKILYSERPDTTCAALIEGKIAIIIDNSPSVMILPSTMFDFLSEANDYYFPPITGTYYRLVKSLLMITAILLTPVWLCILSYPEAIPPWLEVIKIKEPSYVPLVVQLIVMEFILEVTRIATLNAPNVLGSAIGIVGALLVGECAVSSGWMTSETVFFMSFLAVAIYALPSFELGYAFKFFRLTLIILTALFKVWGLIGGSVLILILAICTKTADGSGYLYPLIPFDAKELGKIMTRKRLKR